LAGNSAVQAIALLMQKGVPESHIIFLNLISVSFHNFYPFSQARGLYKTRSAAVSPLFYHEIVGDKVSDKLMPKKTYIAGTGRNSRRVQAFPSFEDCDIGD
jgi:hypothetical protein